MNVLYLDCLSGISGDMTVGALLDLGADPVALRAGLDSLGLEGWRADIRRGMKGVLAGTAFRVELDAAPSGPERSLKEIEIILAGAAISEVARLRARSAFRFLAEAEATVHGISVEEVHFHEVGAADAILDIVGAAICLDLLAPARVVVSPIPMARGFVKCRHGRIPLPAPATLELAKGMPIRRPPSPTVRELATPTGLALAKAMADEYGEIPEGVVQGVGYGLGKADFEWPNVLRAILLEVGVVDSASGLGPDPAWGARGGRSANLPCGQSPSSNPDAESGLGPDSAWGARGGRRARFVRGRSPSSDIVRLIETNLDDMPSEALAHALDRLMAEGALDAWLTPIHMKKGRPGFTLGALCHPAEGERLAQVILRETTTLGLRFSTLDRVTLPREVVTVTTDYGPIRCKIAQLEGGPAKVKPEFEDCRAAAEGAGVPLSVVTAAALRAATGP